jgi:hypothetical protein
MDAGTGQIIASAVAGREADDGAQVRPLLDQVAGPVASFTGDGAYDQDGVYAKQACSGWPTDAGRDSVV